MQGSGPHGRVIARDIEQAKSGKGLRAPAAPAGAALPAPATPSDAQIRALYEDGSYDFVPHDQIRKIIAQRLTLSKQTIPHFYLTLPDGFFVGPFKTDRSFPENDKPI